MSEVDNHLAQLKAHFATNLTKDKEFRKGQLRALMRGIKECKDEMEEACFKDLGRSKFFTELSEVNACMDYCEYFLKNLDSFMKDEHFDSPLLF